MKQRNCPQEELLSEAVRTGLSDVSLARHTAECLSCGEIVRTSRWMQELASGADAGPAALPDASLLWWRAQLAAADSKFRRSRRTVEWLHFAPILLVSVGVLVWAVSDWRAFQGALAWLSSDVWSRMALAGYLLAMWEPNLLWPALALASLAIALLAYPLLQRA